ncbi:MAG: hypothetical protein AAF202_06290, partial [Pseudomonadota bacterium]
ELAEYSMALNRVGVVDEASKLLESLESSDYDKLWLYKAFVNMTQWNYTKAATCLRRHLKMQDKDSYAAVIAKVNLAAAYVFLEKAAEAEQLLAEIIEFTKKHEMKVLFGNAHELLGQVYIQKSETTKASKALEVAFDSLKDSHGLGSFFVNKWRMILEAKSKNTIDESLQTLRNLEAEARKISHWETIRDCDYIGAQLSGGNTLVEKLYYGTPFKEYRSRLKRHFQINPTWRHSFTLSDENSAVGKTLHVGEGKVLGGEFELKPGGVLHELLFVMTRDFYKPMPLGLIFSRLYPGEYFDPVTSFDRAFNSIQRLRNEFQKANTGMEIAESGGAYMFLPGQVALQVDLKEALPSRECLELRQIKSLVSDRPVKLKELLEVSGLSESKMRAILTHPENKHKVQKIGKGPGTRYKLVA